jgi:release factor glutamine methyltransferase
VLISELYKKGVKLLQEAGLADPELEVSLLLAHYLQKSRSHIYLSGSETVPEKVGTEIEEALRKRLDRIPLAYIIGEQEFWSLPFIVSPDVLIPRPETEELLEIVLSVAHDSPFEIKNILDLGTGSGVIAIVLAMEFKQASVVAVDRYMAALKITGQNIVRQGLSKRVHRLCSDWGSACSNTKWDLIVSNPPYVAREVMADLQPEVRKEPGTALDGGKHGMETISVLASQLEGLLKPGGWFFMEMGYDQEEQVLKLFQALIAFENIKVHKDHAGLPRVLQAQKKINQE